MMRLKSDLLPALLAVAEGRLGGLDLEWSDDPALCVVMAAKGYPGAYAKGTEIKGLDAAARDPDVQVFHAGTKRDGSRILADGGRVLGVTAKGRDIREAQAKAYAAVDKIDWPGGFCRRDIGWRAVSRLLFIVRPAKVGHPVREAFQFRKLPHPAPAVTANARTHHAGREVGLARQPSARIQVKLAAAAGRPQI